VERVRLGGLIKTSNYLSELSLKSSRVQNKMSKKTGENCQNCGTELVEKEDKSDEYDVYYPYVCPKCGWEMSIVSAAEMLSHYDPNNPYPD